MSVGDLRSEGKVSLGVWHLVPENLIDESKRKTFDFDDALANSGYDVVIYFHGNSGTRIAPLQTYFVLRKFFHVIAFDYRSKFVFFYVNIFMIF